MMADINPEAVELAKANTKENAAQIHAKVGVVRSDLFSNVSCKFDIITFNAPYLRPSPFDHSMLSKAWNGGKDGIGISLRFLDQITGHAKRGAAVILLASSLGNIKKLTSAIASRGRHTGSDKAALLLRGPVCVRDLLHQESVNAASGPR